MHWQSKLSKLLATNVGLLRRPTRERGGNEIRAILPDQLSSNRSEHPV